MQCNICGSEEFANMGARPNVRCAKCNSLERTRIQQLYIDRFAPVKKDTKILHVAPDKGLAKRLYEIAGDNCTFTDLQPENFQSVPGIRKLDLCNDLPAMASDQFDLILHSHVLEHVPCNYTYVLYHLHRLLKPSGKIIYCIPIMGGYFDSGFDPKLTDEERIRRFGQNDHVMRMGSEDLQMTLGKVYELDEEYDLTKWFSVEELQQANVPKSAWHCYSPSSVMVANKEDYLLM